MSVETFTPRPRQAWIYAGLFIVSAVCMALLGLSASGYFLPVFTLLAAAWSLWSGRGVQWFSALLNLNNLSAVVLILVLWLGEGLGHAKLNIAGLALLGNLFTGGPLMGVLALPLLLTLHLGKTLKSWFAAHRA